MTLFDTTYSQKSSNCVKHEASAQLISSVASQNKLKVKNKYKLLFNSFSDKLFFQPTSTLPNRTYIYNL
jgi:hypothetical protein